MQIALIGFMGSGKSTLGKLLAQELSCTFIDADAEIERVEGMSIPVIFETKGEAYFRLCEQRFVTNLNQQMPSVISCGGGLPCFNDLMSELKKKCKVVYLKLSVASLVERLKNDAANRPVLSGLDEIALKERIQSLVNSRESVYNQADIVIEMDGLSVEASLEKLKLI